MTRKIYRTAQGRLVDLGALQLQNENVRAVGNMSVNARGDLINADNRPIDTRNDQLSRQYRRQTATNVSDTPVTSSSLRARQQTTEPREIPAPPEDFDDEFVKEDIPAVNQEVVTAPEPAGAPVRQNRGGLAAAIAAARQVTQEPIQPLNKPQGVQRV